MKNSLEMTPESIYEKMNQKKFPHYKKYIEISVDTETDDGESVNLPFIKYSIH